MPEEIRIPLDPERMAKTLPKQKTRRELRKWRHYAMCLIGMNNLKTLESRGLRVIPEHMYRALLQQLDTEKEGDVGYG